MSELEVRAITESEWPAYRESLMTTFGDDVEIDPDGERRMRTLIAQDRAWMAFSDGVGVATAASYDLVVGVPGGTLPMAGLTMVTVRPTHRRRGILTRLMATFLADARTRGYPLAGLWASEGAIYGRFGFGVASETDHVAIDTRGLELAMPGGVAPDPCELVDEPRARAELPAIYARATAARPGVLHRSPTWWHERRFVENGVSRRGASRRRHVIARRDGEAVGYVAYRQRPTESASIIELVAIDARADASLWRVVLGLDLHPKVTWDTAPIDLALPWLVADNRRVARTRVDALWLRIEDVAAALAGRHYACDGTIAIAVDGGEPWRLDVREGRARCERASDVADVQIDRAGLSSIVLGGVRAELLARAGRASGDPDAIATLDRVFAWPIAPWCPEVF